MTGYSKKIMKQKIIPILIVLFGFALLSYPFISNYIFEKSAGSTIKSYEKQAKTYDQKQKDKAFYMSFIFFCIVGNFY